MGVHICTEHICAHEAADGGGKSEEQGSKKDFCTEGH